MKTSLFSFICSFLLVSNFSHAQSTCRDWTKNDCDNNQHQLFTDLNNGKVVILDFVMQCSSCITATRYIDKMCQDYKASHPDKVICFATDYNNGRSCEDMNSWKMQNSFSTISTMTNGTDDVSYYGGMGMPTIVVVGGADHKVYYKKQGFARSDDAVIRKAIDDAINATSDVRPEEAPRMQHLSVFPNPTQNVNTLSYSLEKAGTVNIAIYTMLGEKIHSLSELNQEVGAHSVTLSALPAGIYTARMSGERNEAIKFVVTR